MVSFHQVLERTLFSSYLFSSCQVYFRQTTAPRRRPSSRSLFSSLYVFLLKLSCLADSAQEEVSCHRMPLPERCVTPRRLQSLDYSILPFTTKRRSDGAWRTEARNIDC